MIKNPFLACKAGKMDFNQLQSKMEKEHLRNLCIVHNILTLWKIIILEKHWKDIEFFLDLTHHYKIMNGL